MKDGLPIGWQIAKLRDIADINPRHSSSLDKAKQITFVRMPALSESNWTFQFTEERRLGEVRTGYTHFAEGDVLFAKITPCMENGKAAVATGLKNGLGCGTTELHVLRPLHGIEPKLVYHFLHQETFRREAAQSFTGTAGQLRVPVSFVRDAEMPLPPYEEQRRILAKLETLIDKVDACQKRLEKIPKILKRFRQSVLAAACSGRLTADWREKNPKGAMKNDSAEFVDESTRLVVDYFDDLPVGWRVVTLNSLLQPGRGISYGIVKPGRHDPDGVRVLKSQQVRNGIMDLSEDFRITKKLDEEYARTRLQGGEVLLNLVGASIGRSAIAPEVLRGANVSRAIAVIPAVNEMAEWIQLNFQGPVGQQLIQMKVGGSAQPVLNLSEVRTLAIPLPSVQEQKEIVRRVYALVSLSDQIEIRYARAKTQVENLTQSILAKAFRGELVPQDPNDPPASELLKRIKKEKASCENDKLTGKKKGRRRAGEPASVLIERIGKERLEGETKESRAKLKHNAKREAKETRQRKAVRKAGHDRRSD